MKTSKISLVGYLIGIIFMGISTWRYYFLYPDIDKLFAYLLIGIAIFGIFFNYNKGLRRDKQISHIDDLMQEVIERR